MRFQRYSLFFAVLIIMLACASACTVSKTGSGQPATETTIAPGTPPVTQATPALQATKSGGLETTINTRFNDFSCIAVHSALGADYLYPDQRYTIWVNTPGTVNVNLLFLKVDDYDKIQTVRPVWDAVMKTWVYDGIAPLIQINDITSSQEKTITIKNQGKYYLCVDDRKESGVSDTIFHVPVKITRL